MTNIEKEFLNLAVIKQVKYKEIEKILGVNGKQLTQWWEELKTEREELSKIRIIWKKKFVNTEYWDFHKWYTETQRKCTYCQITEPEIKKLIEANKITTKRLNTRGRRLEIERKKPNEDYDKIENLTYSCYWCNNAKTDEFSTEEFLEIGIRIGEIWKQRLNQIRKEN
jgi:5-methylcytosine-specific restriction endonuclease McrA